MKSTTAVLEFPSQKVRIAPLLQIVGASLFIGLCAQIKIPLYFTPVPLTGQTFAVLLIAAVLKPRQAVWATLLYLFEGLVGLPVYAGGRSGLAVFFGPTAGYLLAYPIQAFASSYLMEKLRSAPFMKIAFSLFLVCCLQLGLGTLALSSFVGAKHALSMGFYPFVLGEAFKSLLVATYVFKLKKSLQN